MTAASLCCAAVVCVFLEGAGGSSPLSPARSTSTFDAKLSALDTSSRLDGTLDPPARPLAHPQTPQTEPRPRPSAATYIAMGGKAKPTKHTAKEIAGKVAAATQNKGGGKAGLADRKGGAAGHAKFKCPSCGIQSPSLKSAEMHWDSKHPKLPFVPEDWTDLHELHGGVTTKGVAVRGSGKEKTVHQLSKTDAGKAKLKEIEDAKKAAKF